MALTDREVRALHGTDKDQFIADGGGLYLRVSKAGTKTWLVRSQAGGARWHTIGRYPDISLAAARAKLGAVSVSAGAPTVREAFDEFERQVLRTYQRPEAVRARFDLDVFPTLADRRVDTITQAQLSAVLAKVVERGSPVAANRLLHDLKHLFDYSMSRGWITSDPAAGIKRKAVGGREKSRDRVLDDAELQRLVGILMTNRFALSTRLSMALVLLTGQRASEVLGVSRGELKGRLWIIPAERTKPKREQLVYLAPATMALLRLSFKWLGDKPFVSDHRVLDRAAKRMAFEPHWTPHDLRRTMASRLADLGAMPHVVEKMLNHQMEGVMAVYNRAHYHPERRAAWRLWASHLRGLRHFLVRPALIANARITSPGTIVKNASSR